MEKKHPQSRLVRRILMVVVFLLLLCSCSTQPTVVEVRTIVLAPPDDLLTLCIPERVKEDTVRALAHGYVINTYEVWKCNNRIQSYKDWLEQQEKLYGNGNK